MQKNFRPNPLKKLWLKLTDADKHKNYKRYYSHHKITSRLLSFVNNNLDVTIDDILKITDNEINVLHDGNAGDIIYALPLLKKLYEVALKPVNLILKINEPLKIGSGYEHPLGNVMLNEKMADGLIPLLKKQAYINNAAILTDQQIHLDLTLFRKAGFALDKGNIARWCSFITGITPDFGEAWLNTKATPGFSDYIIIARSSRYNNVLIDYSFLSKYKHILFIGVETEYEEMKKSIPTIKWHPVNDFLQMAQLIAGCKLFIGNQSFPYAIAEGLKVKRLLEVFYQIPNVMPEGKNGYDFCFQKHFEWLVKKFDEV